MGGLAAVATAEPDPVPSQSEVEAAEEATQAKARDVAAVQADLVLANQRLQDAEIAAAQAAEAYNGALWRLTRARAEVRAAEQRESRASAALTRQRQAYGDAIASSYRLAPQLTSVSAILGADGPTGVMERYTTLHSAESAMDGQYDEFRATSTLANVATKQAEDARTRAATLERRADAARAGAQAAEDSAAAEARSVAGQTGQLIQELAQLQDISVSLAGQRQRALEEAAAEAAAAAAQQAAQQAAQEAAQEAADQPAQHEPSQPSGPGPSPQPTDEPTNEPDPDPTPAPSDPPSQDPPADPPPSASGARAAVAFARAQLGEPYVRAGDGPNTWDCSGLTMRAWQAGGKYLPHYSVAQYQQSTPISPSDLRAGDLVFWGSSGRSSSIYHVALYVGDGMIIHAPRPERGVELVSMYYWITPNFYARP